MDIKECVKKYNHNLSQRIINKPEDWYETELIRSNTEFLNWLFEKGGDRHGHSA